MADSIFEPVDGDRFIPTEAALSPWSDQALHGGPPTMLMAREIERFDSEQEMLVARLTVELLRPVGRVPLTVKARMVRPGRKVQLVEASLWNGEVGGCACDGAAHPQGGGRGSAHVRCPAASGTGVSAGVVGKLANGRRLPPSGCGGARPSVRRDGAGLGVVPAQAACCAGRGTLRPSARVRGGRFSQRDQLHGRPAPDELRQSRPDPLHPPAPGRRMGDGRRPDVARAAWHGLRGRSALRPQWQDRAQPAEPAGRASGPGAVRS